MISPKRRQEMARAQAALRCREQDAGIVRVLVKIPQDRKAELQQIAAEWLREAGTHKATENNRGSNFP